MNVVAIDFYTNTVAYAQQISQMIKDYYGIRVLFGLSNRNENIRHNFSFLNVIIALF